MTPPRRRTFRVFLPEFVEGEAIGFEDRTWNGSACPLFDKEGADALVEAWRTAGERAHFSAETDEYTFETEHEEPDSFPSEWRDGVKVWAIGAGCWVWRRR